MERSSHQRSKGSNKYTVEPNSNVNDFCTTFGSRAVTKSRKIDEEKVTWPTSCLHSLTLQSWTFSSNLYSCISMLYITKVSPFFPVSLVLSLLLRVSQGELFADFQTIYMLQLSRNKKFFFCTTFAFSLDFLPFLLLSRAFVSNKSVS